MPRVVEQPLRDDECPDRDLLAEMWARARGCHTGVEVRAILREPDYAGLFMGYRVLATWRAERLAD